MPANENLVGINIVAFLFRPGQGPCILIGKMASRWSFLNDVIFLSKTGLALRIELFFVGGSFDGLRFRRSSSRQPDCDGIPNCRH